MEDNFRRLTIMTEMVKNGIIGLMLQGRGSEYRQFTSGLITDDLEAIRFFSTGGKLVSSAGSGGKGPALFDLPLTPKMISDEHGIPAQAYMPIYNSSPCQRCHGSEREVLSVLNVELSSLYTRDRIYALKRNFYFFFALNFMGLFLPLLYLLNYFVTRPVKEITETVKGVSKGDLSLRAPVLARDEIGGLARELNGALASVQALTNRLEASHGDALGKMEKMASLGELAAAIAHEIKNPLAGISGAIQVLAEDIPNTDPRKEIIREILNEIDRIDQSIRNLLIFAGPPEPRVISTHVAPVVERAKALIAKQAEKQGVRILLSRTAESRDVQLDPEQMQQVFLSIMLYALQSMPSGGALDISIRERDGDHMEAVFTDTGKGISPEDLMNIFKPSFTTKHTGTGLALAIGKNIVESHGGAIEVRSRPGLGSAFHVIIPYLARLKNAQS